MSYTALFSPPKMSHWDGNSMDYPDHYQSPEQAYEDFQTYQRMASMTQRQQQQHHQQQQQQHQGQQQAGVQAAAATVNDSNNFLFVTDNSKEGRRNARSFVMQKARAKDPWSTSKKSKTPSPTAAGADSPEGSSPVTSAPRGSKSRSPRTAARPSSSSSSRRASHVSSQMPLMPITTTTPAPSERKISGDKSAISSRSQ